MIQATGFEKSFCDEWEGWDELGEMAIQFYKAKLNIDLGDLKAGDTVDCLGIDLENCTIQVYNNEGAMQYEGKVKVVLDI